MSDVITTAGLEVEFTPPGSARTYRLAVPSFGQAGRMVAAMADRMKPSAALFNHATREALKAARPDNLEELLGYVDAYEAAEDEMGATHVAFGREDRQAIKAAHVALNRAERGLRIAEAAVWGDERLARLRQQAADADRAEAEMLAREALRGWQGEGLPAFALGPDGRVPVELLARAPAQDVAAIARRVGELTRPSAAAEKN